MNNLVLQKILHGHQLISDSASRKDWQKWATTFIPPRHYKHINSLMNGIEENWHGGIHTGMGGENISPVPRDICYEAHKAFSKNVSQAAKFYLDLRDNQLTEKEYKTIESELVYYTPYKQIFLQVEFKNAINNILIYDHTEELENSIYQDDAQQMFTFQMMIYDKERADFCWDLNQYDVYMKNIDLDTSAYYAKFRKNALSEYLDGESNDEVFANDSLHDWILEFIGRFRFFMIALQHPTIVDKKDVKGRNDIFLDMPTQFKNSALTFKPKFQHRHLKINLFGNEAAKGDPANNRSSGTAFHSVRKHLRKLQTGKHIFVKAHFRGSKEQGLVTKDYEIVTKK